MDNVEEKIKAYLERGWKAEQLNSINHGYIITPEGDVFQYEDLINKICPLCPPVEDDSEENWCDGTWHNDALLKRIDEAEKLTELIDEKERKELLKYLG